MGKTILIVEDNAEYYPGLQKAVEALGMSCIVAQTTSDAVSILREREIDGLILDCHLPVLTFQQQAERGISINEAIDRFAGISLLNSLRSGRYGSDNQNIPVAFNSGEQSDDKIRKAELANRNAGRLESFSKLQDNFFQVIAEWVDEAVNMSVATSVSKA